MLRGRLLLLGAVSLAIAAIRLGESRALDPHEIYVAGTATEMLETGELLIPSFNGKPRIEKPPLAYWLAMAAHESIGDRTQAWVSELEARLPSWLAAGALLFVTYALGVAAFEPRVGLLAAAFLATSWDFFTYARSARPEMLYALACTVALLGFVRALRRADEGRSSASAAFLAWSALAVSLLAKGPQIPAFFVTAVLVVCAWTEPRRSLRTTLHPWMGIVAVAAVAPYFIYVAAHTENALAFWTAQVVQDKPVPLWLRPLQLYYPMSVFAGLVPWLAVVGYTVVHCWRRRDPRAAVLVGSILVTLFFLSFAGKLRRHYVLRILPACTVLMAWAVAELHGRSVSARDTATLAHAADAKRARITMRRLIGAQSALTVVGMVAIVCVAFADKCGTLAAWPRLFTLLVVAGVLAWLAYIERGERTQRAIAILVAALFVIWCAVASSGIDASRRWLAHRQFARDVRDFIPQNRTLLYDSGTLEPLVYYGGLRLVPLPYEQWSDESASRAPRGKAPLFVCENECASHGVPGAGRFLHAAPVCGKHRMVVLFEPARVRRRALMRHSCAE
jgi:4-amino-4-deoxy-L-arabinose transferase-like glycosyltransferase